MKILSFMKGAGMKIFGKSKAKKEAAAAAKAPVVNPADEVREHILGYGFEIENFDVRVEGERVILSGKVNSEEIKSKILVAAGNVEGIAEVEDHLEVEVPAPEPRYYTVKKGDFLSKIAREMYGNANKYPVIFEANKPMLKDPDLIYPGQVLVIPPLEG